MILRAGSRHFVLIGAASALALAVSGWLYVRGRSADFHLHAQVVEAFGDAARASELASKQVLAARSGLLNQYDPLNATEAELARATTALGPLAGAAVGRDPGLDRALAALGEAVVEQDQAIERFKAENSVLRNSLYYLPTAGRELMAHLPPSAPRQQILGIRGLTEAALFYNLVGDESARAAYGHALAAFEESRAALPAPARAPAALLLSHARVIRDKQGAVDGWVKRALDGSVDQRLFELERAYDARFARIVATSNFYRRILYGWSVLLALAVAGASVQLRRLYTGLERRVALRTADLGQALEELWGEMRLAQKIQEALVPRSPTLEHCEVAAAMRPAEQVGGDYYDVLQAGGREWILIGDVSGHGVPAGLVMMMCHTAVRTVLRGDPDVGPRELLVRVNAVLTENIRQLGEDKYMTLTAFRRDADGTVRFAGAHQDVLVYRAEGDRVEVFETEGVWLGIKPEIAHSLRERRLRLAAGDVLVVYTDGITEAVRDGSLFDTAGLRAVLARAGGRSAEEIVQETFRALEGYDVQDDATMLVVKQLPRPAALDAAE